MLDEDQCSLPSQEMLLSGLQRYYLSPRHPVHLKTVGFTEGGTSPQTSRSPQNCQVYRGGYLSPDTPYTSKLSGYRGGYLSARHPVHLKTVGFTGGRGGGTSPPGTPYTYNMSGIQGGGGVPLPQTPRTPQNCRVYRGGTSPPDTPYTYNMSGIQGEGGGVPLPQTPRTPIICRVYKGMIFPQTPRTPLPALSWAV